MSVAHPSVGRGQEGGSPVLRLPRSSFLLQCAQVCSAHGESPGEVARGRHGAGLGARVAPALREVALEGAPRHALRAPDAVLLVLDLRQGLCPKGMQAGTGTAKEAGEHV